MGQLVFILGKPGTGKSYSLRNFPKDMAAVINVQGKILPFKGAGAWKMISTDDSDEITEELDALSINYKVIIIDDYQYVMANEFMRRSTEKGFDKFTDIGRHAWDIANKVRELPPEVIVYILCHTDTDSEGLERLKTIGRLLDEKIYLEGMSTIVLKTHVEDGKYTFITQNNGKDTVKSPAGMFPSYAIENDLHYVDEKIRSFYELGEHKTDEEMAEADAAAAHEEIQKEEPKKKRSKKEEPADEYAGAKEPFEKARRKMAEKPAPGSRSRRISQTLKEEREQVMEENLETLLNVPEGEDTEVPFTEEGPELKPLPRRKSRVKAEAETAPEPAATEEAPAARRRGRRRTV